MSNHNALIVGAVVVCAVIVLLLVMRQQRSKKLRRRFGPEYEHAVEEYGSATKAEDSLRAREKRVSALNIHSLPSADRLRFADQWHEIQSRFVDDPGVSIERADKLVCEIMNARGYPMTEFESRAEDLSVDHPHVVRNYRAGHAIAMRRDASTEELRRALVYYRDLCDELLEAHIMEPLSKERTSRV